MRKRKILAGFLAGALLATQLSVVPAWADARKVVTLGANLSEEQKRDIFRFFGVTESEVDVLTITNDDEVAQLGALIPREQIGTRTYSCALVSPTTSGGIQVKTANMNYVTSNMIASTLSTSGVINCDVLTAAPFEVSGTGALTGVMMAYETASGEQLDADKKELANEELVTTGTIADTVGQDQATLIVNDIKIHIIRDELKEQSEINTAVDTVIDTTEKAAAAVAEITGQTQPAKLQQDDHERLYEFGYKVGQMNYNYNDMKITLQRVTRNVTDQTGIEDPIVETFDDETGEEALSNDSILNNTDDEALGDAQINATNREVGANTGSAGDVQLRYVGQAGSTRFIDGTQLLRLSDSNNSYAVGTLEGQALTPYIYHDFTYQNGYLVAGETREDIHRYGALKLDGTELVPAQYGDVDVKNAHWILGTTLTKSDANHYDYQSWNDDSYYLIDRVDFYHVANNAAVLVGSLDRDNYLDSYVTGDYIAIQNRTDQSVKLYDSSFQVAAENLSSLYDDGDIAVDDYYTYRENGQQGVKDAAGNVVLTPQYQYVYDVRDGYVVVSNGEKEGLMSISGQLAVPVEFDDIQRNYDSNGYIAAGYVAIILDDKLGYADLSGNVTMQPTYSKDILDVNGASAVLQDLEGNVHILAADSVDTLLDEAHEDIRYLYNSNGLLYRFEDGNSDYGLIDWHGNVLFEIGEYSGFDVSKGGNYLLASVDYQSADLYEITYAAPETKVTQPETAATETEPVQAETAAPETEPVQPETGVPEMQPTTEPDPVEAEAQSSSGAAGTAVSYIDSAISLAETGLQASGTAVAALLTEAAKILESEQPQAAAVLQSAVSLLADANVDEATIMTLIQTARNLIG